MFQTERAKYAKLEHVMKEGARLKIRKKYSCDITSGNGRYIRKQDEH